MVGQARQKATGPHPARPHLSARPRARYKCDRPGSTGSEWRQPAPSHRAGGSQQWGSNLGLAGVHVPSLQESLQAMTLE